MRCSPTSAASLQFFASRLVETMSKQNKVNKDHYVQRGRLTPDELARQRARQVHLSTGQARMAVQQKYPRQASGRQTHPTMERTQRPAEEASSQVRSEREESDR
jgi:hypothetical protein